MGCSKFRFFIRQVDINLLNGSNTHKSRMIEWAVGGKKSPYFKNVKRKDDICFQNKA